MAASFVFMELNHINETLNERAKLIINELASNIEFSLFVKNYEEVEKRVNDVLKNEDVVFCALKDNYGQIIYENGDKGAKNARSFQREILREKAQEQSEETMFGIPAEKKESLGILQILVSEEPGRKAVAMILVLAVLVTSVVTVAALLFSKYFVNKLVALPIQRLMEGTVRVADGDFKYKVEEDTNDEIGVLRRAKPYVKRLNTLITKDYGKHIFFNDEAIFVADKEGVLQW